MNIAERRRKRSQLYTLLSAVHAGPLGFALVTRLANLTTELYSLPLPAELASVPEAEAYRRNYSDCPGTCIASCIPNAPQLCLPAMFDYLADSARRGANKRRLREAEYLRDAVLPCLAMRMHEVPEQGYHQLLEFSRQVVLADMHTLLEQPAPALDSSLEIR